RGEILLGRVIPQVASRHSLSGRDAQIQFLLDGSDSNTASLALGYAEGLLKSSAAVAGRAAIQPAVRVWYNNDLKSRNYIVPGLTAVILMIIASLLTSMTIAKEWENGTMEQLLSTPVRPTKLLVGKLSAYFVLGVLDMLLALGLAVLVMHVPFRGNLLLL